MSKDQEESMMELPFAMNEPDSLFPNPSCREETAQQEQQRQVSPLFFPPPKSSSSTRTLTSSNNNNIVPDLMTSSASSSSIHFNNNNNSLLLDAAASLWCPDSSLARQIPDPKKNEPRIQQQQQYAPPNRSESSSMRSLSAAVENTASSCLILPGEARSRTTTTTTTFPTPQLLSRPIVHQRTEDSFEISVTIHRDPFPFLSNASYWRHWCTPITPHSVIITSESSRRIPDDRMYEGIWTEATIGGQLSLVSPLFPDFYRLFGCPVFSNLSLFVQPDIITATLGPFIGGTEQRFKFTRTQTSGQFQLNVTVRIVSPNKHCWLFLLKYHRDQVVTSVAQLRYLVEDRADDASLGTPLLSRSWV